MANLLPGIAHLSPGFSATTAQPYRSDSRALGEGAANIARGFRMQEAQKAMMEAYDSGDEKLMARVAMQYPEISQVIANQMNFANSNTEDAVKDTYRRVIADPANAERYIQAGIGRVQEFGGNPVIMSQDLEMFRNNPEEALKKVKMTYAAYDPKFVADMRDDKTAAIKNYEYFTSIINDPNATKAQKDNARRQLGEIGKAGALPSSISYRDQDFILNPEDGKYYRALDNKTLDEVQQQEAAAVGGEVESKEIAKQRAEIRKDAVKGIQVAQSKIKSYDEAIRLIDQGASTEKFEKALPTLKTATSMLESVRSSLALDTLKGVSLGALSEKEMEVLQETSIPSGDPKSVREWIVQRKEAEKKLISMLKDQVIWMNENKGKDPSLFYIENGLWDGKKPDAAESRVDAGMQQAPQAAIDFLMANPELKEQFRQKYGYLPEGI